MSKKAVVWSQPNCPYCDMAKKLLESRGYEVEERKIGFNYTKDQFLESNPGARSVPQIYLEEELVPGGYAGLAKVLA